MAELSTTRMEMPYPDAAEPANVPADIQQLAQQIDAIVAGWLPSGTLAARPAPAATYDRHFYFAHDTAEIYGCVDAGNDGSYAWVKVYPFIQEAVQWADILSKPATFPPSTHSHAIADLPVAPSGTSNTTQVVRADDSRLSNERTPINGSVTFAKLAAAAVAASGVSSATALVRADDSRLADARPPVSHSHAIADLPVATSGTSSSTQVVRADDSRLSNERTPVNASVTYAKLAAAAVAGSGVSSSTALVRADDLRLSNSRTPTTHASTHASGGSDPVTPVAIGAASRTQGGAEASAAASGTTGTITLNAASASIFTLTPTGNVTATSITNPPASGNACTLTLIVTGAASEYTFTPPTGTVWLGSAVTSLKASKVTVFTFLTVNGGSTWYASAVAQS